MRAVRLTLLPSQSEHSTWNKGQGIHVHGTEEGPSSDPVAGFPKSSDTSMDRRVLKATKGSSHLRNKRPSPLYTQAVAYDHDSFLMASCNNLDLYYPANSVAGLQHGGLSDNRPQRDNETSRDNGAAMPVVTLTSSRWPVTASSKFDDAKFNKSRSFWEEGWRPEKRVESWNLTRLLSGLFAAPSWNVRTETNSCSHSILVSVHVLGSPGPLRLLVDRDDSIMQTINSALHRYASQGRLPALGLCPSLFGLYCRDPDFQALDNEARIGEWSTRHFHLYHKKGAELSEYATPPSESDYTMATSPVKTWIWDGIAGIQSWAAKLTATVSHTLVNLCLTCSNPWRFDHVAYVSLDLLRWIKLIL